MLLIMQELEYSQALLDNILGNIKGQAEKDAVRQIIGRFYEAGLTINVKHIFPDKPWAYYRMLCFIKKSAEAVIVNTKTDLGKEGIVEGISLQLRITNQNIFERLNEFTDNIRGQILDANDCRYCSAKCAGKQYAFDYQGHKYVKCHYICSNFRFNGINENNVADIMLIIDNEFIV